MCLYAVFIVYIPSALGAWVNHRVFRMDYMETIRTKRVYSRRAVWLQFVILIIILFAVSWVYSSFFVK